MVASRLRAGERHCKFLCDFKTEQQDRLEFFCSKTEGFKIAARDLELHGAGDLASSSDYQSRADLVMLIGRTLNMFGISLIELIYKGRCQKKSLPRNEKPPEGGSIVLDTTCSSVVT